MHPIWKTMKNIAFVPSYVEFNDDKMFDRTYDPDNRLLHYATLKKHLIVNGFNVHTIDTYSNLESVEVVIFERIDFELMKRFNFEFKDKLLILVPWEPEVVNKLHSVQKLKKLSKWFDYILTWNDLLLDDSKFFKLNYPNIMKYEVLIDIVKSFESKKLLVQVSSNKSSVHKLELYSLRKKFNLVMNQLIPDQFDFYGYGWSNNTSYNGMIENKSSTLSNYKFSLCFENMKNGYGYITEKIFDCFRAGVVPIYYGSDNITDYIPNNCFIDYRDFKDPHLLLYFINNMDFATWNGYLINAKTYLESESSKQFSIRQYIETIDLTINKNKVARDVNFYDHALLYFRPYQSYVFRKLKIHRFLSFIKKICL